MYEIEKKYITR